MLEELPQIAEAERLEAVRLVLASQAFARSNQLRNLLRYLCEREIAGRGAELTEYQIGVDALGRPANFSPLEDAVVRNRTHALRRKLKEVYERELAGATVRINLPKGSYQPGFLAWTKEPEPERFLDPARRQTRWLQLPVALVILILVFEAGVLRGGLEKVNPLFSRFWGPLLIHDSGNIGICVTAPLQLIPREFAGKNGPPDETTLTPTVEIQEWYRQQSPNSIGTGLRLIPTRRSPRLGEGAAALAVAQFLGSAHVPIEVLSERIVKLPALRNRNAVLVGSPEYSDLVGGLLANTPFTVSYDARRAENVVVDRQDSGRTYGSTRIAEPDAFEQYGLITVLSGGQTKKNRTLVFSGTSSASAQGAAEYFTSRSGLEELGRRIPPSVSADYQVVVKVKVSLSAPMGASFASYRLIR